MVWIIVMIIGTISTFIFIKYIYGKNHMCLWRTFENQKHGTLHYTKYAWGDFLLMGVLISFCESKFLRVFHSTRVFASLYSPSKNLDTCPCPTYTILINTLFAHPHASHQESTPNIGFLFLKKDLLGFKLELIMISKFNPCLYNCKNVYIQYPFFSLDRDY